MADPTRPVQDAIIDPAWGQWVHDAIANKVLPFVAKAIVKTTDPGGVVVIWASDLGLSRIDGGIVQIGDKFDSNYMVTRTDIDSAGNAIQVGVGLFNPAGGFTAGANAPLAFQVVAWGAPT